MTPFVTAVAMVTLLIAAVMLHFIPAWIGHTRLVPHRGLLFVVNLLAGWSVLGWIACLLYACLATPVVSYPTARARVRIEPTF